LVTGVAASLETDASDDWLPLFAKRTGISGDSKLNPLDLAYQLYLEILQIRSLKA